jgi:hypothetical protein
MASKNLYKAPFYYPPSVKTPIPDKIKNMAVGEVILYKDSDWDSETFTIATLYQDPEGRGRYPEGKVFSFVGHDMNDNATWIAFRLPRGTVCTLFDKVLSNPSANPFDFAHTGVCVDLIGIGDIDGDSEIDVQTVDLAAYGANDCLSCGVWRQTKLDDGWFQLFKERDCGGTFSTVFFSEWANEQANSLANWNVNKPASINYPCLCPPQWISLTENIDGTGLEFDCLAKNKFGQWNHIAQVNLAQEGVKEIQSFRWRIDKFVHAEIKEFEVTGVPVIDGHSIREVIKGDNLTTESMEIDLTAAETQVYTISVTTTFNYSMALTLSTESTAQAPLPGGDIKVAVKSSFSVRGGETLVDQVTTSETRKLAQAVTIIVPPNKKDFEAEITIGYGNLPSLPQYKAEGKFYYKRQLPGSEITEDGSYVLAEQVKVNFAGGFGTKAKIVIKQ